MSEARKQGLADLAIAGERGRAAIARLSTLDAALASALRRALPFLARKRVPITVEKPRCILFEDLQKGGHTRIFATEPAGVAGALAVDEVALARIFEGVLGAGSNAPRGGFTPAQNALASRLSEAMVRALSLATAKIGAVLDAKATPPPPTGPAVVATLVIDGGGSIKVALPIAAIAQADGASPAPAASDGIARAMLDVELDVVAELGKIKLSITALADLKVGDVVRLTLPLDERARISAGGITLFRGRPTTNGELVAIEIEPDAIISTDVKDVTPEPLAVRHAA